MFQFLYNAFKQTQIGSIFLFLIEIQLIMSSIYIAIQYFTMYDDITCVFQGFAGVGAIYISNLKAAKNKSLLKSLDIKAVLTVARGRTVEHSKEDVEYHLYIPADDIESYDLSKHFEQTYNFLDDVRKKTNVLVHCYAGISRSATIVIAYLLRKFNYSLSKVIAIVKRRRNKINPNRGFLEQLKQEAKKMNIPINEAQFEQLLKPPVKKLPKHTRRASSAHKTPSKYTLRSWMKPNKEEVEAKDKNDKNYGKSSLENHQSNFYLTTQTKSSNFRQVILSPTEEDLVERKLIRTVEKYSSVNIQRKSKYGDLTEKIQRIKSKVLEKNGGHNKKKTTSLISSTLIPDYDQNSESQNHRLTKNLGLNIQVEAMRKFNNF